MVATVLIVIRRQLDSIGVPLVAGWEFVVVVVWVKSSPLTDMVANSSR